MPFFKLGADRKRGGDNSRQGARDAENIPFATNCHLLPQESPSRANQFLQRFAYDFCRICADRLPAYSSQCMARLFNPLASFRQATRMKLASGLNSRAM